MYASNSQSSKNNHISRPKASNSNIDSIDDIQVNGSRQNLVRDKRNTTKQNVSSKKSLNPNRIKFNSIIRRLRNLMEYCVNALNEASSTSCSNKFDPKLCEGSVWLLGKQFELPRDAEKLVADVKSKLWITYRRDFPPIDDPNRYTSDRGFGCMIRCGQMVLANALIYKNVGRDWLWTNDSYNSNPNYQVVLKSFQDKQSHPYSIHNIVRIGQQEGKNVGEWFGPNTIAQALKRQAQNLLFKKSTPNQLQISIDTALDNIVVVEELKSKFKKSIGNNDNKISSESDPKGDDLVWVPGILFIQLRLGLTKINPIYFGALKRTFQFKHSLGIIGGRPNHALYLIGNIDDDIVYLDPHNTQRFVNLDNSDASPIDNTDGFPNWMSGQTVGPVDYSYHCDCVEKMPLDKLDPSLALCFYFESEKDFDYWCELSNELLIKSEQAPMFEITKSRPSEWSSTLDSLIEI